MVTQLFIKNNYKNANLKTVRDTRGQILYFIEGYWGRKDDLISLSDVDGQHILSAKQKKLSPFPIFHFYTSDEKVGTLRKHPGLFGIRDAYFTLDPHEWIIAGDFEDLYFTVHQNNFLILECEKVFLEDDTVFIMDIKEENDTALASIIAVLLDHYTRGKDSYYIPEEDIEDDYNWGLLNNVKLTSNAGISSLQYQFNNKAKTR